ncbi:DUF4336 domain-containing protein [Caulobacter mirabilis]|uniref:DUF4336 domain-containing protein n=1 Tax=Caulobacter mirabilis TaxID=69666 RepID=A0A2D2B164_9CAUL|nr:DUF4336 domain-containing protein [Caulobacter mirabilis]ATQ44011.1 hypothetical protein CSW64_17260 [Caulobacter mirabilis]
MTDRLEPIGDDIWLAEGPSVRYFGLTLTTRSTVVRLAGGGLWVHSPIALDDALAREIEALGEVRELIAPNAQHHLHLGAWMARYPAARAHAAPGLRPKRPDLAFASDLGTVADAAWAGEIAQTVFPAKPDEVLFFHARSSTAILTDLIINIRLELQSPLASVIARLDGIAWPRGGVSRLYRMSVRDEGRARAAAAQLLGWRPAQAVIAHGEWFRRDATEELARRLGRLAAP